MLSRIRHLFSRRSLRFGLKREGSSRLRDPRFASFLAQSNRRSLNTDFQDAVLRGRKLVRHALVLGLIAAGTWVVVESAHAVAIFK
ncbi:MAG TPA: hypothetical protein VGL42_09200 [Opitutaceae bacterium]|jgi:hypothetical protein